MSDHAAGDRRIAYLERELAMAQTDATYSQIEANLVRERLKATLVIAVRVASRMSLALAIPIDEHLEDMGQDFVPR